MKWLSKSTDKKLVKIITEHTVTLA